MLLLLPLECIASLVGMLEGLKLFELPLIHLCNLITGGEEFGRVMHIAGVIPGHGSAIGAAGDGKCKRGRKKEEQPLGWQVMTFQAQPSTAGGVRAHERRRGKAESQ